VFGLLLQVIGGGAVLLSGPGLFGRFPARA
jgi:hypothetical protein